MPAPAPYAGRIDWVDHARGICIILVVMMHSVLGVEKAAGTEGYMGTIVEFARPFRMPDFFLISGLFLSRVIDRNWKVFGDRRILHFVYFYVLWLTIQFAFKAPEMAAEQGLDGALGLYLAGLFWEPFGTLWFIWMLPVFAVTVRLTRRLSPWLVLAAAAALQIAPIDTGWLVVDEFASRFVYYFAGYMFAPAIFAAAARVATNRGTAFAGLLVWAAANGALVFSGLADLPVLALVLGFAGAGAVVVVAVLLSGVGAGASEQTAAPAGAGWRLADVFAFLGRNSIVIYLAFFLPMAISREVLLRIGVLDVGTVGLLVTASAVVGPLVIWWLSLKVGARFLFERPGWARIERPRPAALAAE